MDAIEAPLFKPCTRSGRVVTARENGDLWFQDQNGDKYRFVGELRFDRATRLSQTFAGHVSRVGLTEFEWLRLAAPSG